jgi:hypothetical protein
LHGAAVRLVAEPAFRAKAEQVAEALLVSDGYLGAEELTRLSSGLEATSVADEPASHVGGISVPRQWSSEDLEIWQQALALER